jgi:acyl carrier protein
MSIDPRLARIFATVLPDATVARSVGMQSSKDDVRGWDSQTFVAIIVAIEEEFGLRLSTLDAARMSSVRAIYEVLREKGVALAP